MESKTRPDHEYDLGSFLVSQYNKIPVEYRSALLFTFLISILAYGFYGFAPVLGREELFYIGHRGNQYMAPSYGLAGRPMAWFISHRIFAGSFIPIFSICFSSLLLSLSGVLLSLILKLKRAFDIALVSSLFAISPLFCQSQGFQMWNIFFATAMLLSIWAGYLSLKGSWKILPLAAILLALTLMTYQTYVSFYPVCILIYLVSRTLQDEINLTTLGEYILVAAKSLTTLLLGCLLYAPIYLYMTKDSGRLSYTKNQNEKISDIQGLLTNLKEILNFEISLLFQQNSWLFRKNFIIFFFLILLICVCRAVFKKEAFTSKLSRVAILLVLAIFFIPSIRLDGLAIANILQGVRLWAPMAAVVAGICGISLLVHNRWGKSLAQLCCIMLLFSFTLFHNVQSFFLWTEREHDRGVAIRLASRIENHPEYTPQKTYFLHVIGQKRSGNVTRGLFKVPLSYSAIRDQSDSLAYLLSFIGLTNIRSDWENRGNKQFTQRIKTEASALHNWPARGSLKFIDGNRILVRF